MHCKSCKALIQDILEENKASRIKIILPKNKVWFEYETEEQLTKIKKDLAKNGYNQI